MPVCTEHSGPWDPSRYRHEATQVSTSLPLVAESLPQLPPVTPPKTLPPDLVPGTKRKAKTKRTDDAIQSAAITDLKRRNLY